jgi:hypothetical protein
MKLTKLLSSLDGAAEEAILILRTTRTKEAGEARVGAYLALVEDDGDLRQISPMVEAGPGEEPELAIAALRRRLGDENWNRFIRKEESR